MKDFQSYLLSKRIVTEKQAPYYINWVSLCYNYFNRTADEGITLDEIENFLNMLGKCKEEWQVQQAREAISLYLYYLCRNLRMKKMAVKSNNNPLRDGIDEMIPIR